MPVFIETAILLDDWNLIRQRWSQLKIREIALPEPLRYIKIELENDVILLVYLIENVFENSWPVARDLVPQLPFCYLYFEKHDVNLERQIQTYEQVFKTPLFLLIPQDENLKEKIAQIASFNSRLPESVIFNENDDPLTIFKMMLRNSIDKTLSNYEKETSEEGLTEF